MWGLLNKTKTNTAKLVKTHPHKNMKWFSFIITHTLSP